MLSLIKHRRKPLSLLLMTSLLSACMVAEVKQEADDERDIVISEEYGVDADVTQKFNQAVELIGQKQYEKAVTLLTDVTARTDKHSAPYVNLGVAYAKLGKIDEAEENLLKALKINPLHPVTNNELGIVYRQRGRFEDAKKAYQAVISRYPRFLPAIRNLGILCDIFMNDLECAIEQYAAYLEYSPDEKNIQIWLTDLQRRAGKN
ncbi:MAG: tetratricopeptide repeat protein [Gammaproteobacteria bacterium]|nr:tetratricopeptide repeat protein [Gammaproteobacteria bacterium]